MSLRINDTAPNFVARTTEGEIDFHDWIGDSYCILFSHPKDRSKDRPNGRKWANPVLSPTPDRQSRMSALPESGPIDHYLISGLAAAFTLFLPLYSGTESDVVMVKSPRGGSKFSSIIG